MLSSVECVAGFEESGGAPMKAVRPEIGVFVVARLRLSSRKCACVTIVSEMLKCRKWEENVHVCARV